MESDALETVEPTSEVHEEPRENSEALDLLLTTNGLSVAVGASKGGGGGGGGGGG
jgi:hypothetical protein